MPETIQRRPLSFTDLDEVVRDVEQLRAKGYSRAGNWDLAQVCDHLTDWMRYQIDGYPRTGCLIGTVLWLVKLTKGKQILREILSTGTMRAGSQTLRDTVHAPGGDEAPAVERLKQTAQRFKAHSGDYRPSPLFGSLTRDEATKLQLVHCAHHLSFLVPKTAA
jgi:hypothetical protein